MIEVDADRLEMELGRLKRVHKFEDHELSLALSRYPLFSEDRDSLMTLERFSRAQDIDVSALSPADLVAVVSAGRDWQEILKERLAEAKHRPIEDRGRPASVRKH